MAELSDLTASRRQAPANAAPSLAKVSQKVNGTEHGADRTTGVDKRQEPRLDKLPSGLADAA